MMVDYIKNFLIKEIPAGKTLLIMGSFSGHKTADVKNTCKDNNIGIMMIPGGYTGLLQPLDISVKRSLSPDCIMFHVNDNPSLHLRTQ
jgi:hypothetical protein